MEQPKIYFIDVTINHPNGIYQGSEIVNFIPSLSVNSRLISSGQLKWQLFDNFTMIDEGNFELGIPGAAISFTPTKPGGYQCKIIVTPDDAEELEKMIGVVIDPEKITQSWTVPDDFDQFWERQLTRLAAVPMKTKLTPIKAEGCNVCDVQITAIDNTPVSGILATPQKPADGSCPAIISLHGAGVRSSNYNEIAQYADSGFIALDINAHGLKNLEAPEYYEKLLSEKLEGYAQRNFFAETPDNIYFVNMFLRVKRAIEFMVSRPEWDGKNLFLIGGSQGAFQTFAGAYLDDRVTAIATGVPAGSNMAEGGWPFSYGELENLTEKQRRQQGKNAPYIDNVSFASKLTIPAAMSVGLIDDCCPSNGVYAVYNAYQGSKVIFAGPEMPHAQEPAIWNRCLEQLYSNLIQ